VAKIVGVAKVPKPYIIPQDSHSSKVNNWTDKALCLDFGDGVAENKIELTWVSNGEPDESEFLYWLGQMKENVSFTA